MKELILFLSTMIFTYIIYLVFIISKAKRRNSKKKPIEIRYLESKYQIDIKKLNYHKLLQIVGIISSFDIALIVSIVSLVNNYLLSIVLVIFLVIPIILISYHIVGKYYQKRGMMKDE